MIRRVRYGRWGKRSRVSVMICVGVITAILSGCGDAEKTGEIEDVSLSVSPVTWRDYVGYARNEWYTYTGYMEDFIDRDLDKDWLVDRLYRYYEDNEEGVLVGYEIHFGNGSKLLLNESGDFSFYKVLIDSVDLTGDGKNEIIVLDLHSGSTYPPGYAKLNIYTYKEGDYVTLKLPGAEKERVNGEYRDGDSQDEVAGIDIRMSKLEDNTILLENKKFKYLEKASLSEGFLNIDYIKYDIEGLSGRIESSNIHNFEIITKEGRKMLRVEQETGNKGILGSVSYLLSWDKNGDYQVLDMTYELRSNYFSIKEAYEAQNEFENLHLDDDDLVDRAIMHMPESQSAYVEILFGDGNKLTVRQNRDLAFKRDFKIMAVDSDADGEKEIFLLLNRGSQGGDGEYSLVAYDKQGEDYVKIDMPHAFPYIVTGDGNKVVLSCKDLGYEEELFVGDTASKFDITIAGKVKDLWEEIKEIEFGTNQADGFCDFSFYRVDAEAGNKESGIRLQMKQYLYGKGHSDFLGYAVTTLMYKDGEYEVVNSRVEYPEYLELMGQ